MPLPKLVGQTDPVLGQKAQDRLIAFDLLMRPLRRPPASATAARCRPRPRSTVRARSGKVRFHPVPNLERPDGFGGQSQAASRCDKFVGLFELKRQHPLCYHKSTFLVKVPHPPGERLSSVKLLVPGDFTLEKKEPIGNPGFDAARLRPRLF
jgi:hypothetical protein